MTVTTPAESVKGSRRFVLLGGGATTINGTTDTTTYVIGTSLAGITMGAPWRATKIEVCGNVTADTADGTFTVTAYNGSVSAGNRALEVALTMTAIAEALNSSVTPTNAGKDSFSATDTLIMRWFYDGAADSVTVGNIQCRIYGEWAD